MNGINDSRRLFVVKPCTFQNFGNTKGIESSCSHYLCYVLTIYILPQLMRVFLSGALAPVALNHALNTQAELSEARIILSIRVFLWMLLYPSKRNFMDERFIHKSVPSLP